MRHRLAFRFFSVAFQHRRNPQNHKVSRKTNAHRDHLQKNEKQAGSKSFLPQNDTSI